MPRSGAFQDKVVWITGASSGIGEALAYELAKHGAKLVLSARREELLKKVADACRAKGSPDVAVVKMNLTDFGSHKAITEQVVNRFQRIDYLVNNGGRSQRGLIENTELAVDRELLELNVLGTLSVTKAVLPQMLSQGGGVMVVTSSLAGKLGNPVSSGYSASKHALHGFFDSLRMEMGARNVRVVMACPGPVESEISLRAITERVGGEHGQRTEPGTTRMPAERCAALIAAAMRAELPEVWMAPQPLLLFAYVAQYCRALYFRLGPKLGPRRVADFKAGRSGYSSLQTIWARDPAAAAAAAKPA